MRRVLLVCAAITFAVACTDNFTEPVPDRPTVTPGAALANPTVAFATTTTEDGLSISTDKDDYQPGDVVHLTGYGWPANDVLDIVLTDDPLSHDPLRWSVNVGVDGTFHDATYVVDDGDLDVKFTLTATTRSTPTRSLTVQFTDGVLRVQTSPFGILFQLTYSEHVGANCTGNIVQSGNVPIGQSLFQLQPNPANANSVLLQAGANSLDTPQGAFLGWTAPAGTFDPGVPPRSICIKPFNGNQTFTAGYKAPDLTITKQAVGAFRLGENATYSLTVSNSSNVNSVATAGTYIVTDNLPGALDFVSAIGTGWFCSSTNDIVKCETSRVIAPGANSEVITLVVAVVGQNINNQTASVAGGGEPQGNAGNNSVTVSTPVLPALASKLVFTSAAFSAQAGNCSPQITVRTQTTNGLAANVSTALTVNLSTSSSGATGGKFYSDATCTTQVTTRTIPTGGDATNFFYKDGTVGSPTLTASATGLTSGTQEEQITAAPNAAPVANNDVYSVDEDNTLTKNAAEGVLSNDTDPENNTLTAAVVDNPDPAKTQSFNFNADGSFEFIPKANFHGNVTFTYKASDGALQSSLATVTITVNSVNDLPVLTGVPTSATIDELTEYTFDADASDVDLPAQTLTFSLDGAPSGASINPSTGAFSWTPTEVQGPGTYTFSVRVGDGVGQTSASIVITVNEVNVAPTLTDVPETADVDEMTNYTFDANASDPDLPAQTLTFSLVSGPGGAVINGSTGVFSWTPAENQGPGTYPFKVQVSDGMDATEASITITVKEVNLAPELGAIGSQSGNEGEALTFTATATDNDLPANALTFSLDGAPAGATIDPSSGVFSWTPGDNTVATFKVVVTDNGTPQLKDEESITVTILNVPPTISTVTATPSGQLTLGSNNQVTTTVSVAFTDPAGVADEPYTKTISCGNNTNASSAGVCTYTAADVGFRTITATVTDKDGGVSAPKTTQVQVIYNWNGFFQPVDNNSLNVTRAGSAVPVKFNLGGNQGLGIFIAGSPSSSKIACDTQADQDTIEETVNAGGSSLVYDASAGQYVYVWKTDKAWVGQCRRLDVKLIDGTTHSATFKFKN